MTNHETWIHDTSDKCTFPILSCYTCLPPGKCKQLRPEHIATVVSGQEFYSLFLDMSQHLPTSISHTKLEIATYIHELADKLLPSTTSQYILLGTTQLAPNTTLHYKACKNYFPVLLCTTKLAQSTPQYYFVLQSLHKVLPSILQFAASKPDLDAKATKRRFWSTF